MSLFKANTHSIRSNPRVLFSFLLILGIFTCIGCGQKTDIVFDVKFDSFLPDGRPVMEIQPNGKPRPKGEGPYGDFYIVLRSSEEKPFTRQFDTTQAEKGLKIDFAVTKKAFPKSSKVWVAVENPIQGSFDKTIRLSNVAEVVFPADGK